MSDSPDRTRQLIHALEEALHDGCAQPIQLVRYGVGQDHPEGWVVSNVMPLLRRLTSIPPPEPQPTATGALESALTIVAQFYRLEQATLERESRRMGEFAARAEAVLKEEAP